MNLVVSNIAWASEEEAEVAKLLQSMGVQHIEIAPTKQWDDPTKASRVEAEDYVAWWAGYGIEVVAFQSILFSRPELKLFEDPDNRQEALEYMQKFINLAGTMKAKKIVFGSPKNRQRGMMSYGNALAIATEFFINIAKTAEENNVEFCIEPNAPQYNCDFITTAKEGRELVQAVNHPGFGLHLDTACMALVGDDLEISIRESKEVLRHFHISSPMLEQVEQRADVDHRAAARALKDVNYNGFVSIEMRPGEPGSAIKRVKKAVEFAQAVYL